MEELMEYASQSTFINKDLKNMIKKSKTEDNPVLIVFKWSNLCIGKDNCRIIMALVGGI